MNELTDSEFGLGYKCCFCNAPIPDRDIPEEVHNRISRQLVWHEACVP